MAVRVYKILSAEAWKSACEQGYFMGSAVDLKDGFIHFSDASQLRETAMKHFAGGHSLVLVAFDSAALGDALQWEPSRGGALFPHLYDRLETRLAVGVTPLLLGEDGQHVFSPEIP